MKNFKLSHKQGQALRTASFAVPVITVLLIYAFFFSSKLIFPNGAAYQLTKIGTTLELAKNKEVTVSRWEYSPSQKLMEIELEVDNQSFDGIDTYTYAALVKTSSTKQLEAETVLSTDTLQVVRITNVPPSFKEISLRMMNGNGSGGSLLKMYTNRDDVDIVGSIPERSETEYKVLRLERRIADAEGVIYELDVQIKADEQTIENIRARNLTLEAEKRYQTAAEIEKTNGQIASNEKQVEDLENGIQSNIELKEEQKRIIGGIQETIDNLQSEDK